MKFLFVDDQPDSVAPVIESLEADTEQRVMSFTEAIEEIGSFEPDIVVLDLVRDGSSGDAEPDGVSVFEKIWAGRFCPVIVYSAQPERLEGIHDEHPFVMTVKKGRDSIREFSEAVLAFKPHVESIQETERLVKRELFSALKLVAPQVFESYDEVNRQQAIVRLSRRRVAAAMDESTVHDAVPLKSWEQFICPPISADLGLGDVLRLAQGSADDPESFRIVLTPSCDLVASGGRDAKVKQVLTAQCFTPVDGFEGLNLPQSRNKLERKLPSILSSGYTDDVLPIPSLKGNIPPMVARLKKLQLVELEEISGNSPKFVRVASIDSPFREMISWAYLQTAGRPGLPDRDFKGWSSELIPHLEAKSGS